MVYMCTVCLNKWKKPSKNKSCKRLEINCDVKKHLIFKDLVWFLKQMNIKSTILIMHITDLFKINITRM